MRKLLCLLLALPWALFADHSETHTFLTSLLPLGLRATASSGGSPDPPSPATALVYAHVTRNASNLVVGGSLDVVLLYHFTEQTALTSLRVSNGDLTGRQLVLDAQLSPQSFVLIGAPYRGSLIRQVHASTPSALAALRTLVRNPAEFHLVLGTTTAKTKSLAGQLAVADRTLLEGEIQSDAAGLGVPQVANGTLRLEAMRVRRQQQTIVGLLVFEVDYQFPRAVTFVGLHIHKCKGAEVGPAVLTAGIGAGAASVQSPPSGSGNLLYRVVVLAGTSEAAALDDLFAEGQPFQAKLHTTSGAGAVFHAPLHRADLGKDTGKASTEGRSRRAPMGG